MTWSRFESRYPQSRKVKPLSDGAFRADVEGICWSNDEGTDGLILADELELIGDGKRKPRHAAELVRRRRWHRADDPPCDSEKCPHDGTAPNGSWVIHDFHDYNPTRAEVERDRAQKRERQKRWRDRKSGRYNGTSGDASTPELRSGSRDGPQDAPATTAPHRSAPPRSEGSGGGAPPSDTAAASSAGGAAAGRESRPRTADPETVRKRADEARAAIRAGRTPTPTGSRPPGAAFAELLAVTSNPSPEDQREEEPDAA